MKKEFSNYLQEIGVSAELCKRIESIYAFYKEACPEDIQDIFISETIDSNGQRVYESLWFFSQKYMMEASHFIDQDNFDMNPLNKKVSYWRIKKKDYDFKKATDQSRLVLEFDVEVDNTGVIKASKENCDYLKHIIIKYIRPNAKE